MAEIFDDKSEHCVPFILERIKHRNEVYESKGETPPPFFIGLNGVQGAGKTTLYNGGSQFTISELNIRPFAFRETQVETLKETLSSAHGLPTIVFSIDDLYLPHSKQEDLAKAHPDNPLVQHRGQPSTHDVQLGKDLFTSLVTRATNIKLPSYDKSAFSGAGDQRPENEWPIVNAEGSKPIEVVMFEGWCVGFRALSDADAEAKWKKAKEDYDRNSDGYDGQLGKQKLESVLFVNRRLRDYDALTDQFDAFVHIDAEDPLYVYDWRLGAEKKMRESKGSGMSDEQVNNFVNGYYPAYELYTDVLRKGIFHGEKGKQLRFVVGRDRKVKEVYHI